MDKATTSKQIFEPGMVLEEDVQSQVTLSRRGSMYGTSNVQEKFKFDGLNNTSVWAFAQGHFYNDMEGGIWFNFCPFYMVAVINKGHIIPYSLLIGQVFDGLMSPLVGIYSQKTQSKWGSRVIWYIWGTLMVTFTTIPMYMIHLPADIPVWFDYAYYIFLPVAMNLGGCILLITHMSLVPAITCSRHRRDTLNARRNTFSFAANLFVLVLALFIFQVTDNSLDSFWWICLIAKIIGLISSFYFLKHIDEPKLVDEFEQCVRQIKQRLNVGKTSRFQALEQEKQQEEDDWSHWFKMKIFYQVGVIYMCARVYFNMCAVIILFYVVHTLRVIENPKDLETQQMPFDAAIVPLIMWIGSVLMSSFIDKLFLNFGKKKVLTGGLIIVAIVCYGYHVMTPETRLWMYPVGVVTGFTSAIILNTGITLIGEVVGSKGSGSTYVYGIYCLCDKVATGLVLYFVCGPEFDSDYVRTIMVQVPLFTAVIMWAVLMTTKLEQEDKQRASQAIFKDNEEQLLPESDELKQLKDEFVQ